MILAIETSSPQLSLAISNASGKIVSYKGPLAWRHGEVLIAGMKKVLQRVKATPQDLTGVLVSTGPGSFTGIRIGLAAARALGQGLQIPVLGVSSLEIMAFRACPDKGVVCPLIDALRGDVFAAVYERRKGRLIRRVPEQRLPLKDVAAKLAAWPQAKFVGATARGFFSADKTWGKGYDYPLAEALLELGRPRLKPTDSYKRVLPLYLRAATAQERRMALSR